VEPVWARPAIDTLATVRRRGALRVGVVHNEPFVMRDAKGDLVGFSIDLGRQLADDLGVNVEFVVTSWSQVVPDLVGKQFDVIAAGLWITPARALVVNFSDPTSVGAVHLVAGKSLASTMRSRQDLDRPDVRIVVYAGTSQEKIGSQLFPRATLVKLEGDADPLAPVVEGKAHAVLVTTPVPELVVGSSPDRLFLPLGEPLQLTTTALAIRKGDADFLNFVDSWLAFQREDGWLAERQRYWFRTTEWMQEM
jgi:polar amino acid transport system substrate-binding protein